jgi:D-proline reductase (dithiol) PrdB
MIPKDAIAEDIKVYHQHIDPRHTEADINCLLPLERLRDLEASGEIGGVADWHYSIMGYILQPDELLGETTPAIIRNLQAEAVDAVLLVPA